MAVVSTLTNTNMVTTNRNKATLDDPGFIQILEESFNTHMPPLALHVGGGDHAAAKAKVDQQIDADTKEDKSGDNISSKRHTLYMGYSDKKEIFKRLDELDAKLRAELCFSPTWETSAERKEKKLAERMIMKEKKGLYRALEAMRRDEEGDELKTQESRKLIKKQPISSSSAASVSSVRSGLVRSFSFRSGRKSRSNSVASVGPPGEEIKNEQEKPKPTRKLSISRPKMPSFSGSWPAKFTASVTQGLVSGKEDAKPETKPDSQKPEAPQGKLRSTKKHQDLRAAAQASDDALNSAQKPDVAAAVPPQALNRPAAEPKNTTSSQRKSPNTVAPKKSNNAATSPPQSLNRPAAPSKITSNHEQPDTVAPNKSNNGATSPVQSLSHPTAGSSNTTSSHGESPNAVASNKSNNATSSPPRSSIPLPAKAGQPASSPQQPAKPAAIDKKDSSSSPERLAKRPMSKTTDDVANAKKVPKGAARPTIGKLFVICCACKCWHDMPAEVYAKLAFPNQAAPAKSKLRVTETMNDERPGLHKRSISLGTAPTSVSVLPHSTSERKGKEPVYSPPSRPSGVKCCWCNHQMTRSCCAGWTTYVHLHERHH